MTPKCCFCNKSLGEVYKAKILKTTRYLCDKCHYNAKTWRDMAAKYKPSEMDKTMDKTMSDFYNLFGGRE